MLLGGSIHYCYPQSKVADSLIALLSTAKNDTNKVHLFLSISDQFEMTKPGLAIQYCKKAKALSEELKFDFGIMKANRYMAYIYVFQAKHDSMIYYNKLVYDMAVAKKDTFNIGVSLFNLGEGYKLKSQHEKGIEYTLRGVKMLEGKGYTNIEANLNAGLQSSYLMLKQYKKSVQYGLKSIALARKLENKIPMLGAMTNLANCYNEMDQYDKAEKLYNEVLPIAIKLEVKNIEALCYEGKLDIAIQRNRIEDVKMYAEKALKLHTEIDHSTGIMGAYHNLGLYYLMKNNLAKAEEYANIALKLGKTHQQLEHQTYALNLLSNIAYAKHDIVKGIAYGKKSKALSDSIFNTLVAEKDAQMRVQYETEKKDVKIKLQQATIRQKNTFNYILIGGAVALLIIILLGYRNYTHRQKIQQQRISELETEKQLAATEAVLKGEEQERSRLAKDLHDGLGGMLSGIKYSFQHMKGNMILTPDNAQAFERSMEMLDSSIKEMRRVAHNMMPEALVKFGLDTALEDFCNDINQSGALKLNYQSIGLKNEKMADTTAITIYRIAQELINNVIKHADAAQALLQVTKNGNILSLTVEDDGKGFNAKTLQDAKGIGWSNIANRVEFLKGKLDVQSEPEKGTSILIELHL